MRIEVQTVGIAEPPRTGICRSPHPSRSLLLVLAILSLAIGVGACSDGDVDPEAPSVDAQLPGIDVDTVAVARGTITRRISAPGSLTALRESRIGAEVRGRIEKVFVDEGERVEAGAPLFRIDPEPYELALREARAGLDLARAERRQQQADLTRARTLRGEQVVSEQEVDRLETGLAVAKAREAQAGEALHMAELNLRRTEVHAPYAGAVAARLADEGTTAQTQPQTIVLVLQESAELEGRATIPEAHLAAVRVGDRALVSVEGMGDPIETEISSVGDSVDPATRTYEVRMRVPNADYRFKAGVFAEVEIHPQAKRDVLLVPREAIRTEDGRTRVLAVRDGLAVAVPVKLGVVSRESAEVLSGIASGERVIVGEEAQVVAPGMRVRSRAGTADAP